MRYLFKLFFSKRGQQIWLGMLLLTPVVLWLLPGDSFDGDGFVLCPSRLFFNIECFGCGMTRAIMHMHHFQFDDAVFYNLGSVVVYPTLIVIWAIWVKKAATRLSINPFKKAVEGVQ